MGASEEINVTSRLSTGALGSGQANLSDAGRLLNADYILSGSYIRNEDELILNLEFSEISMQRILWSQRMEISVQILLKETDIVHEIIAKIRRAIVIREIRKVKSQPLESVRNCSLLFASVGLMHRFSPDDFHHSRELLDTLIARAPNHPIPLAWSAR